MNSLRAVSCVLLLSCLSLCQAFAPATDRLISRRQASPSLPLIPKLHAKDKSNTDEKSVDPLSKTSWYVVEAFGKVFGSKNKKEKDEETTATADTLEYSMGDPPQSAQETLQRILDDYNRSYFLSGEVDAMIYDEQCVFSDPFVSFAGRDRFIENLANLGSFITNYSVKPLKTEAEDPLYVKTKCMVKLELGLPWKPILAWPWGVDYTIDGDTFLITEHKESWDIEPLEGVKQIFRKPTTNILKLN